MTSDDVYSPLQRSIMPIVSWQEEHFYGHGTAFSVGVGGLMITAAHVLDLPLSQSPWEIQRGTAGLFVVWEYDEPEADGTARAQLLRITAVHQHPDADLALITVEQPILNGQHVDLPPHRFAARLPDEDEVLRGSGYPVNALSGTAPIKHAAVVTYDRTFVSEAGTVSDRHPAGRDRGLLPFSVVRTDAVWPNGVSGGPVVDDTGAVIGVVSAGLNPEVEGGAWMSFVCLIAPVLQLSGQVVDPTSGAERTVRFGELAADDTITFDIYDTVDVVEEDHKVIIRYRFPE